VLADDRPDGPAKMRHPANCPERVCYGLAQARKVGKRGPIASAAGVLLVSEMDA
jgi:hypothetical protein